MTLDTPLFLAVCVIPVLALVAVSVLVICCCHVVKRRKKQKDHLNNVVRRIEERRRRHSDSSSVVSRDRHSWTAAFRHRHMSDCGPPYHDQCTWPATWSFVNDLESLRARNFYQDSRGITSGRPSHNRSIAIEVSRESGLPLSIPSRLAPVGFAVAPPYTSITIDGDGQDEAPPPYEEIFGSSSQLPSPPPSYNSEEGEEHEDNSSSEGRSRRANTQL